MHVSPRLASTKKVLTFNARSTGVQNDKKQKLPEVWMIEEESDLKLRLLPLPLVALALNMWSQPRYCYREALQGGTFLVDINLACFPVAPTSVVLRQSHPWLSGGFMLTVVMVVSQLLANYLALIHLQIICARRPGRSNAPYRSTLQRKSHLNLR
jgi:hypothetical protein